MEIITALGQLHKFDVPCVVALGTFDGLHRGHVDVIRTAREQALKTGGKLAVFTFSNHPYACFRPDKVPPALITPQQKQELLRDLGVNVLVDIPFDMSVARLEPEQFLQRLQVLGYSCLVVGSNFTYGIRGEGTVATLKESAAKLGFTLLVRSLVSDGAMVISSTAIRRLIAEGDIVEANRMLGRSYSISGTVAHGNERGRLLGYPTANLELEDSRLAIPSGGVYVVRVLLGGKVYGGMANIGKNPTFGDVEKPRLETHIFDFAGDIYGRQLTVQFVQRVRGEVKFTSLDALKAQLAQDKAACLECLQSF
ncbi:bifunctional riboflavin kinase/FAD synthetase [uncultured Phascolarctobacterium sp.]|uniref:bifunctional riboflavin kinase/FAD synthetase n=1 Tax=uncultured Phascolarctobacterium sp. TaxID=512296 RepID=UPI0025F56264|nr:bifunctional riboflavin kinase/FAD synthetase [uncultured Phascolarctobacterium sp.]